MRLIIDQSTGTKKYQLATWSATISGCPYLGRVTNFGPVKLATAKIYGGLITVNHGKFSVVPKTYATGRPPTTTSITARITNGTDVEHLFTGTARLHEMTSSGLTFDLFGQDKNTIVSGKTYRGPLRQVVSDIATTLGLVFVPVNPAGQSPEIDYKPTSTEPLLRVLSDICAWGAHWAKIEGGRLYLGNMLQAHSVFSHELRRAGNTAYAVPEPYYAFAAADHIIPGSNLYGRKTYKIQPVCATSDAYINKALINIRKLVEMDTITTTVPMDVPLPKIGQEISWHDRMTGASVTAIIRGLNFDFKRRKVSLTTSGHWQ